MNTRTFALLLLAALSLALLAACGGGAETTAPAVEEIDLTTLPDDVDVATVEAIRQNPGVYLLDVREPDEYAAGHIPGITLIPMGEVATRLAELPRDKEIIVTCRSGNRSGQVADLLREQGFTNVHNMEGGIIAWEEAGYPVEQ
jgi:rhodanese-related sulfurtransferase